MALTLEQLFTVYTPDQCKQRLLDRCAAKGLPITDWEEGGVARTLIEIEAQENSDFSYNRRELARSAFLDTARGDWLTLVAQDFFGIPRAPATRADHTMLLNNESQSSISIEPGQMWMANDEGLRFYNAGAHTIPSLFLAGTYYLPVTAEGTGTAFNTAPTRILTPIPGLSLDSCYETTTYAVNEESDAALIARCRLQWSTLGHGMSADAYKYWAMFGGLASVVNRVKVATDPTGQGIVSVYVAGGGGAVGAGDVTVVQDALRAKAGGAVTVNVYSATNLPAAVACTALLKSGQTTIAEYRSACYAAMQELIASLDIGQPLYKAQILEALMSPVGVVNVTLSAPSGDYVPTSTQVVSYVQPDITPSFV